MKTLGIVVLVLGIIMTIFTGFNVITKEKVVDIGPLEINKEEKTPIYWSPITGGILIVAGAIILVAGRKKFLTLKLPSMIPDKVLYTDGRGISVTDSVLKVKAHSYRLNGISKHGLLIMRPDRAPGLLLLIVGFIVAVVGILNLIPPSFISDININNESLSANVVAIWAGAGLALIGLLVLAVTRERYAVRIATAEGEKNVIVSTQKEYISQIVNALNEAFSHDPVHSYSVHDLQSTKVSQ